MLSIFLGNKLSKIYTWFFFLSQIQNGGTPDLPSSGQVSGPDSIGYPDSIISERSFITDLIQTMELKLLKRVK